MTKQNVAVDWINCTFPKPDMSASAFVSLLGRMMGRPVSAIDGRGMLGFETSVSLFAHHGSAKTPIGCLAFGGESQRGRWLFQLTGSGCQFVKDWEGLADFLESLEGKLTRVDLALDFIHGEHTVEEATSIYGLGGFDSGGRRPKSRVDGDWINEADGRTLYVGRATNGKMLRVYEKGRQLGDAESPWTRFEVQLGSRDRVLPFACLTRCDAFFAGCYPVLATMIDEASEKITTHQEAGEVTVMHLLHHFKRCYGKLLDCVLGPLEADNARFIENVRIVGVPKRLPLSSVAAGLTWEQVHSRTLSKESRL